MLRAKVRIEFSTDREGEQLEVAKQNVQVFANEVATCLTDLRDKLIDCGFDMRTHFNGVVVQHRESWPIERT